LLWDFGYFPLLFFWLIIILPFRHKAYQRILDYPKQQY